jgi:flagellar basal body P-ring formation protein FlgA
MTFYETPYLRPLNTPRVTLSKAMIWRLLLTAGFLTSAVMLPAMASSLTLKSNVVTSRETMNLGDLVENVPYPLANQPMFRAPELGKTGTIQTQRILAAARDLGLSNIETQGRSQITVTRASRTITGADVTAMLAIELERQHSVVPSNHSIILDGESQSLSIVTDIQSASQIRELRFDGVTRRFTANFTTGNPQQPMVRVSGKVQELMSVPVMARNVTRGEGLRASDIRFEKRLKGTATTDILETTMPISVFVARRDLSEGALLRSGDVSKPVVVNRGDLVTLFYSKPGISLTLRGKAMDSGAVGDSITVQNLQSKRMLSAKVDGAGRAIVMNESATTASR